MNVQANLGEMDDRKRLVKMVVGNLVLVEAQAVCMSSAASVVAVILGYVLHDSTLSVALSEGVFLAASAVSTACVAGFLLGTCLSPLPCTLPSPSRTSIFPEHRFPPFPPLPTPHRDRGNYFLMVYDAVVILSDTVVYYSK